MEGKAQRLCDCDLRFPQSACLWRRCVVLRSIAHSWEVSGDCATIPPNSPPLWQIGGVLRTFMMSCFLGISISPIPPPFGGSGNRKSPLDIKKYDLFTQVG